MYLNNIIYIYNMGNSPSAIQVINQKKKIIFDNLWNGVKSKKFGNELQSLITSDKEHFFNRFKKKVNNSKSLYSHIPSQYDNKDEYLNDVKEKADLFFDNIYHGLGYELTYSKIFNDNEKGAWEDKWDRFFDEFLSENMTEDDYSKFAAKLFYSIFMQRDINSQLNRENVMLMNKRRIEKMIADAKEGFQNNETENDFSTIILIIIFALLFLHAFTNNKLF